jgi:hypothetical protein
MQIYMRKILISRGIEQRPKANLDGTNGFIG